MAGNYLVRLLLEQMIDSANSAYLGILERWVYEGLIDDPHDEFFIAENKSLQKVRFCLLIQKKYKCIRLCF
ncbi:putative gamma-tubulin complex component protein [Helianthus annuus]|uniref:Gamma-tubulin complex component n=1 Tax=Helianthus annuus TaxID=4232 RepID=A0A9K3EIZ1_HELAN|nr:putative gamma-tubulin complex component protein [Helianthus annuus]KAJ0850519.1 putative gamma-tubulin complex component protein [Helianthus annuus]